MAPFGWLHRLIARRRPDAAHRLAADRAHALALWRAKAAGTGAWLEGGTSPAARYPGIATAAPPTIAAPITPTVAAPPGRRERPAAADLGDSRIAQRRRSPSDDHPSRLAQPTRAAIPLQTVAPVQRRLTSALFAALPRLRPSGRGAAAAAAIAQPAAHGGRRSAGDDAVPSGREAAPDRRDVALARAKSPQAHDTSGVPPRWQATARPAQPPAPSGQNDTPPAPLPPSHRPRTDAPASAAPAPRLRNAAEAPLTGPPPWPRLPAAQSPSLGHASLPMLGDPQWRRGALWNG